MQPVVAGLAAIALAAAASACSLHDLAEALEAGRAAAGPHDWPYAAACAAFANTTEETWCGPGVRNSPGFAALAAAAGPRGAYVVAAECDWPLPQPARFGDGRSAESEELLSIDGSAPTSPV